MSKPRTVKLFCPSLSKVVQLVAWDEQRLDLGSIAGAFGLEPSTVKLNGHFISRGVDLVSNSVTWKSLLKFFSHKGLSTGRDDKDAVIVDGKLCKLGTKRSHDCEDDALDNNKKMRDKERDDRIIGFKRKQLLEDVQLLKKLRINETKSDFRGKCSYLNENLKRRREQEGISVTPCKRSR